MTRGCRRVAPRTLALVAGEDLSPARQAVVWRHAERCPACREALGRLARGRQAARAVLAAAALGPDPDPARLVAAQRPAPPVRRTPRRRRWLAALLLLAPLAALSVWRPDGPPARLPRAATPHPPPPVARTPRAVRPVLERLTTSASAVITLPTDDDDLTLVWICRTP